MPAPDITVRENGGSPGDIVVSESLLTEYLEEPEETVDFDESLATLSDVAEAPVETVALSESVASAHVMRPPMSETVSLLEQVRGGYYYLVDLEEEVDFDEETGDQVAFLNTLNEALTFGDALEANTAHEMSAAVFEGVTVLESVEASQGAQNPLAEEVDFEEGQTLEGVYADDLGETVSLVELLQGRKRYTATPTESAISLSDAIDFGGGGVVGLGESVSVSDLLVTLRALHVAPAETVTLAEAVQQLAAWPPEVLIDVVDSNEELTTVSAVAVALAESVSLTEQLVGRRAAHQGLAASVSLAETGAPVHGVDAGPSEMIPLGETVLFQCDFLPPVFKEGYLVFERAASRAVLISELEDDPLELAEARVALYGARVRPGEALSVGEALHSQRTGPRALGESVGFAEAGAVRMRRRPALAETVTLAEARATHGVFKQLRMRARLLLGEQLAAEKGTTTAALNESLVLVEAQLGRYRVSHQLGESLSLAEVLQARVSTRFRAKEGYLIFEARR